MPETVNLPALQNLIKRDPEGYQEEFLRRYRHFQSVVELHCQKPTTDSKDLVASVSFVSAVSPCFPQETAGLPAQLSTLLEDHHASLDSALRSAILQALILLRNRGLMPPLTLLQLCFRLFRCNDKQLRERLFNYVVSDIKNVNLKHKDVALNKALQNYVIGMLSDTSMLAAKQSLMVMIQMYRRSIWKDAKTVNVVAGALTCPHTKLRLAAIHFLLGAHDDANTAVDSDDEEAAAANMTKSEKIRASLAKDGAQTGKSKNKMKRALKRAGKATTKRGIKTQDANGSFAAIHLLHDPQSLADNLLGVLRKSTDRFEVRLLMITLISRLIGVHQLLVPAFYPYVQRYMQPHQKEVTTVLAASVQACHELVPPEMLQPLISTLVTHFVSDKSRGEMITVGLNTVREMCARVPLAMDSTLLSDLLEYRKSREKGVVAAARSLLQLYRQQMPELLHKKLRGRSSDMSAKPALYGALQAGLLPKTHHSTLHPTAAAASAPTFSRRLPARRLPA